MNTLCDLRGNIRYDWPSCSTVIGWVTSSLSVRSSFWLEEEQPVTEMGGLPGTMQGALDMMSAGTRPMLWDMLWDMGVRYDV